MKQIAMIGLEAAEIPWLRLLIVLLRHPDPVVRQVVCEALHYLEDMAARADQTRVAG
ncbi:MAG: hypothetical protein ABSH50_18200 [Bryobacteraceae bacterium]|jgi:hypothetical protein